MYTRRFFISATLAPLLIIALMEFGALLTTVKISIGLAVTFIVPYFCFAACMLMIGLKYSPGVLRRLSYRAPVVFLFFQSGYMLLAFWFGISIAKDVVGLGAILIFMATYIVIFGYLYVFVAEQMYISYLYHQRFKNKIKFGSPLLHDKLLC